MTNICNLFVLNYIIILFDFRFLCFYKTSGCEKDPCVKTSSIYVCIYISVQTTYSPPSELFMSCDRSIDSNSYKKLWKICADVLLHLCRHSSNSVEKIHFQGSCVTAVSAPLADPCVLSRTITEDAISNELRVEAQRKHLHTIFDPPPQKMC